MRPAENIAIARDLLFEDGWAQCVYKGDRGERCLSQAVMDAAAFEDPRPALEMLAQVIAPQFRLKTRLAGGAVVIFNDERGRTFSEIVDVCDKAIKLAEQDESA